MNQDTKNISSVCKWYCSATTDVLINGGFEVGDFTDWTQYCADDMNCGGSGTRYGQLTKYRGPVHFADNHFADNHFADRYCLPTGTFY